MYAPIGLDGQTPLSIGGLISGLLGPAIRMATGSSKHSDK